MRFMTESLLDYEMHVTIETTHNFVPDAPVYPQENGPCEHIVEQEDL
jgi:hypothetical protein